MSVTETRPLVPALAALSVAAARLAAEGDLDDALQAVAATALGAMERSR